MKTKFFRKLSFVLVVAMVLSLFVPAAGAFAAAKPKLNSTNKYLHLGVAKKDEFNFNISDKQKGWKYYWESADEDVAEVNENNGVTTAVGVGKTKITCEITDADGEEVAVLEATVTVRDNIKEVKISNPVEGTLAVGATHDFNRSFVTVSGSTKKTSAITRWSVEPADGATIDDKGVFVATKAGEYKVIARSFQSKARYTAWQEDADKYADYVLATDETTVVVSASIVGIKQIDKNIIDVEFDGDMKTSDISAETVVISRIINGTLYNTGAEKVKSLTLSEDGKTARVETYGNFVSKGEYQFAYGELTDKFDAAEVDIAQIAGLIFEDFSVLTDSSDPVDLYSKVKAVNSDGVVIFYGTDYQLQPYLSFEYKGDVNYGWIANNKAYIIKNGETAQFDVKYTNHVYDEASKTYKLVEYSATAIGVGVDVIIENTTLQYAVKKVAYSEPPGSQVQVVPNDWDSDTWYTSGFAVPVDDQSYGIYTKYKRNSGDNFVVATVSEFTYVSTDTDKLIISGNFIYPIAQGVVTVLVQDPNKNNAVIGAFDITIKPARSYVSAVPDTNVVSLGNIDFGPDNIHNESRSIAITNTDSMGSPIAVDNAVIELISYPNGGVGASLITLTGIPTAGAWNYGTANFGVSAENAVPGTYTYKITLRALGSEKVVYIYVNVLDASDPNVVPGGWRVEMTEGEVDLKGQNSERKIYAYVYGYNARNARVAFLTTSEYELEVVKAGTSTGIKFGVTVDTIPVAKNTTGTALAIPVAKNTTGTALEFVDLTTYQVTAKALGDSNPTGRAAETIIGRTTFTVKDTTQMSLEVKKTSVSAGQTGFTTVHDAAKEALVAKFDWNDIGAEGWNNITIEYTIGGAVSVDDGNLTILKPGNSVYVKKLFYTVTRKGNTITYTYNVERVITITK